MRRPTLLPAILGALLASAAGATETVAEQPPTLLQVGSAASMPLLDGSLEDWPGFPDVRLQLRPAVDEEVERTPGEIAVEASVRVHGDVAYFAFRWPDPTADVSNRGWRWQGSRYRRGRELDDQFAVRFAFAGEFDLCMISDNDYAVDVWLWSAGRSALSGHADDMRFVMATSFIDEAAEYEGPHGGTVYIKRYPDAGGAPFQVFRPPRTRSDDRLGAFVARQPDGSRGDVTAAARWRDGYWHLELARLLHTGHADDVSFLASEVITQVAVFDHEGDQFKSVSGELRLRFPGD